VAGKPCRDGRGGVECWCVSSDSSPQLLLTDLGFLPPWGLQNSRKPQRHKDEHLYKRKLLMCKAANPQTRHVAPPPRECSPSQAGRVRLLQPSAPTLVLTTMYCMNTNTNTPMNTSTNASTTINTTHGTQTREISDDMPTPPEWLTSQCCTVVSIDTCTAVARFLSRFWGIPAHGLHTPGFSGVWVRVALENPRVTRANP